MMERQRMLAAEEEFCGFCGYHVILQRLTYTQLLVECVPIQNPLTPCCQTPEEPPPGSFAIRIIKGSQNLNGQECWCIPDQAILLRPFREEQDA